MEWVVHHIVEDPIRHVLDRAVKNFFVHICVGLLAKIEVDFQNYFLSIYISNKYMIVCFKFGQNSLWLGLATNIFAVLLHICIQYTLNINFKRRFVNTFLVIQ